MHNICSQDKKEVPKPVRRIKKFSCDRSLQTFLRLGTIQKKKRSKYLNLCDIKKRSPVARSLVLVTQAVVRLECGGRRKVVC